MTRSHSESVLDVRSALDAKADGAGAAARVPRRHCGRRRAGAGRDSCAIGSWIRRPPAGNCTRIPPGCPARWPSTGCPALGHLGDACVFQGSVWCEQRPAGWEAELRGVFRQVDLEQLVTRQFPHKLSGSADVDAEPLPGSAPAE